MNISHLKDTFEQAYRLLFGKKRERYTLADNALHGWLFEEEQVAVKPEEEQDEYTLVKCRRPRKKKLVREPIPDHLPREVVRLEPDGGAGLKCIGVEVPQHWAGRTIRLWGRMRQRSGPQCCTLFLPHASCNR